MIRIKGFARKTRRLTKGGSMPENARENGASLPNFGSVQPSNGTHSNGSDAIDVNSREYVDGSNRFRRGSGRNGRVIFNPNAISRYLRDVITGLVNYERRSSRNGVSDSNGARANAHAYAPVVNGPLLQTVFARATSSLVGKVEIGVPLWKRILDLTCIVLTLPVWLPLLLLVMLWIKAVSPGPIFYRQERVGYRRSRFMIFKFRTMHANVETRSHEEYFAHLMRVDCPMTKLDAVDDSRLVRCGRLLRASGLDELPQIFNVLRGEMSLVGPRPCLPNEFERYQPWHRRRVNAPPGLTGYWQVNGKNKTTFSQMIALDILYTKKMSLWLDLRIMFRTIPALISQTIESRVASRAELPGGTKATVPASSGSSTKI